MSECVLVHGSFGGGWVWEDVATSLRKAGHTVHTPTLTGVGERSHLVSPNVGLSVNIKDIVHTLMYQDLEDIVLIGHSYAGLVITGVAEACAHRINRLVYFDGFVPEDGESAWDINPNGRERWRRRTERTGTDWLVSPPDPAEKYDETGSRADEHRDLMTPMAMWTHEEPIRLPNHRASDLPRSYIECLDYEFFREMGTKAREGDFDHYEFDTHHNPIFYEPEQTSDLLRPIIEPSE